MYDVIIVGSGPAGMSAALYASRANLKTLLLEKDLPGGQMLNTELIENYVGASSVNAIELASRMSKNSREFGAEYKYGEIESIEKMESGLIKVVAGKKEYEAKAVIVATGTAHKILGVPGELGLSGKGVSYCATCDGAFFQDKEIAVVGGGDSALESALFLTQYGNVHLIHRRKEYRAKPHLQELVKRNPKIKEILSSEVNEIIGSEGKVSEVRIVDKQLLTEKRLSVDGVFVNIGQLPQTKFLDKRILDKEGWVIVDNTYSTEIEGLYAIGDVIQKEVRQVANAVGDGSEVVHYVFQYIQKQNMK